MPRPFTRRLGLTSFAAHPPSLQSHDFREIRLGKGLSGHGPPPPAGGSVPKHLTAHRGRVPPVFRPRWLGLARAATPKRRGPERPWPSLPRASDLAPALASPHRSATGRRHAPCPSVSLNLVQRDRAGQPAGKPAGSFDPASPHDLAGDSLTLLRPCCALTQWLSPRGVREPVRGPRRAAAARRSSRSSCLGRCASGGPARSGPNTPLARPAAPKCSGSRPVAPKRHQPPGRRQATGSRRRPSSNPWRAPLVKTTRSSGLAAAGSAFRLIIKYSLLAETGRKPRRTP
jgi:hypothetical protein